MTSFHVICGLDLPQSKILGTPMNWRSPEKNFEDVFFGEHLRLCPWSLALASSIPVLGLERFCPRKGCPWPWPWPRIFFVSLALALASSLVSSTPPLIFQMALKTKSGSTVRYASIFAKKYGTLVRYVFFVMVRAGPQREKFPGGTKVDTGPPKPYQGPCRKIVFCRMGVDLHLKVRG